MQSGAGSSINLTASGGNTYQWLRNGTPIVGATTGSYIATNPASFTATATTTFGCTAPVTGSLVVTQIFAPQAAYSFDSYCTNKAINFTNQSTVNTTGAVSYTWADNIGGNSTNTNVRFTYNNTGNNAMKLKVQSLTCSNLADSVTQIILVEVPRPAIRQATIDIAIGEDNQLQVRNFGTSYTWLPATGLSNSLTHILQ